MQHQQIQQLREHLARVRMAAGLDSQQQAGVRNVSSRERLPPVDADGMGGVVGAQMSPGPRASSSRQEGKESLAME